MGGGLCAYAPISMRDTVTCLDKYSIGHCGIHAFVFALDATGQQFTLYVRAPAHYQVGERYVLTLTTLAAAHGHGQPAGT